MLSLTKAENPTVYLICLPVHNFQILGPTLCKLKPIRIYQTEKNTQREFESCYN